MYFCGQRIPNDLLSSGNFVDITFLRTENERPEYPFRGFNISWQFTTETTLCGRQKFTCKNRNCIGKSMLCDGHDDCGDASDEDGDACKGVVMKAAESKCGVAKISPDLSGVQNYI